MRMPPRVCKTPRGIYVFRYYVHGVEKRLSLKTRDPQRARYLGYLLNHELESMRHWGAEMKNYGKPKVEGLNPSKLEIISSADGQIRFTDIKDEKEATLAFKLASEYAASQQAQKTQQRPQNRSERASDPIDPDQPLSKDQEEILALRKAMSETLATIAPESAKFEVAIEKYRIIESRRIDSKSVYEILGTVKAFQARNPKAKKLGDVTKKMALDYYTELMGSNLSLTTVDKKIKFLKSFFRVAIEQDLLKTANPFETIKVATKKQIKAQQINYSPFTQKELNRIFDPATYFEFFELNPSYVLIPVIALYTGARAEEIASMRVHELEEEDGVWFIRAPKERVKNTNSIRKIVFSQQLEGLVLKAMQHIASFKKPNDPLFYLTDGKNGYNKALTSRWGLYLDSLDIKAKDKVFHSLRHTFISEMTNTGCNTVLLMRLVGHIDERFGSVPVSTTHQEVYNKQEKPIKALQHLAGQLTCEPSVAFKQAFLDWSEKFVQAGEPEVRTRKLRNTSD